MNKIVHSFAVVLLAAVPFVAGAQVQGGNGVVPTGSHGGTAVTHSTNGYGFGLVGPGAVISGCGVTDMVAFDKMIAAKPTPAKFRELYSCVHLVLPGEVTTREFRSDNSRYMADLDTLGHIVGGSFR